ncbi:MAG: phosphatidate cytidylyltransferase [Gammaproteobacteria bacterium]
MITLPHPHVGIALLILLGLLVSATLISRWRFADQRELQDRIRTWWWILGLFSAAVLLGQTATLWLLAFISYLALKEYFSLIPTRHSDRSILFWAYLAIPAQYYLVAIGWYGMFIIFIPVYMFLLIPLRRLATGEPEGFLRSVGTIQWGLMICVFSLSHGAYLLALPSDTSPAGGIGLLLFLLALTQLNDVAQYLWGKALGKRKVAPHISPGKTVAGLVGGVLTTTAMATLFAPWLTPLSGWQAPAAGLIVGLAGFAGDITISAIKRDLNIKDSGSLLPGHGGILDRVDSLSYTTPLFFHFLYYLHY